ncbi:hypothetical protein [Streptomyces sp. NPDC058653]|uniref:hypothetical protein n=1 Tax=Streptomyces sp. NPDC058653 TaxID=3346576 RepID=UPI00364C0587
MNDRHPGESHGNGAAVPRDLPDQHARPGDDPLDVEIEGLGSSGDTVDPDSARDPDSDSDRDPDPDKDRDKDPERDPDSGPAEQPGAPEEPDPQLPETDEAGAGRRGNPSTGGVHEQPVPDEPSG